MKIPSEVRALALFHLRSGIRVALRASPALFSAIAGIVVFQDQPNEFVASLAKTAYATPPKFGAVITVGMIAVVLSSWARARVTSGGWIRHLPIKASTHRQGLILALIVAQAPLILMLGLLGLLAHRLGSRVRIPLITWMIVIVAAAMIGAARRRRLPREWRGSESLVMWRVAWRALGSRLAGAYVFGIAPLIAGWFMIRNNALDPSSASAVARFAGSLACLVCMFSLVRHLALQRPAWPFARSLPWSARERIIRDSIFLGVHALPFLVLTAVLNLPGALVALILIPYFSIRAAETIRKISVIPSTAFAFLLEGIVVASCLTLLPWIAAACILAVPPALHHAERADASLRVTAWSELNHAQMGDTGSWSSS